VRRCLLAAALVCAALAPARADEDTAGELPANPVALERLQAGQRLYAAADYDGAIAELEAGHRIEPRRVFLFAIAQSHRHAGRCPDAVELYRRYLAENPPEKHAQAAREGLKECGASDEPPVAEVAAPTLGAVPPAAAIEASVVTTPAVTTTRSGIWYRDPLGNALAASGAVGLAVGTGFVYAARSSSRRAEQATTLTEYERERDAISRRRVIAVAALTAGSAMLGVGVYRWIHVARTRREAMVTGWVDPERGAGVVASWRF
jgi:hypothetical protein